MTSRPRPSEAVVKHPTTSLKTLRLLSIREAARGTAEERAAVPDRLLFACTSPEDMTDFLALYWADGRCPLAACIKRGLAKAFQQFAREDLAVACNVIRRDRPKDHPTLRDILFLVHPKPVTEAQARDWKDLANGEM